MRYDFKQIFGVNLSHMPLWLVIVLPFVVLIATAMGLTAWVSLYHGRSAVDELAVELNQRITDTITGHVSSFTEMPLHFVQVVSAPYRAGETEPRDYPALERTFLRQLHFTKSIDALYYGNEDGHFVLVKSPEQRLSFVRDENTGDNRHIYEIDEAANHLKQIDVQPYDPRQRPWYRSAIASGTPTWSPVYLFAAESVLGISPVVPIHDQNGKILGVFAADLTLLEIANFLRGQDISSNGQAFIIERSGHVVATSSAEPPFTQSEEGRERLFVGDSQNNIIRVIASALQTEFGSFERIGSHKRLSYDVGEESHFVQVTEMQANGLDWLLVVAIPKSDFMAHINASTRFAKICVAVALLAAVVLGAFTARGINRSIRRVGEASAALASGELDHRVELDSVNEIQELGRSFNQMSERVRSSIRELENANEQLEDQVEQRAVSLKEQRHRERELTGELDIANQQLELLATTDAASGFANHRRFSRHMTRQWAQCVRDEAALSLVVLEVSARTNDGAGREGTLSEQQTQELSGALARIAMRPSDLVARCGLNNFALILPATNLEGATTVARSAIEHLHDEGGDGVHASMDYSFGIGCMRPTQSADSSALIELTNAAVKEAQRLGHGSIVRYASDGTGENVSSVEVIE